MKSLLKVFIVKIVIICKKQKNIFKQFSGYVYNQANFFNQNIIKFKTS